MKMLRAILVVALASFIPSAVAATINASSCGQSSVQTALNSAANGDTVSVPAGSCSWPGSVTFSNSKGVSLVCATQGACTITASGTAVLFDTLSGNNANLYRISGFNFRGGGGGFLFWFFGTGTLQQIRIDHNTFANMPEGGIAIFFGETSRVANYYGVIDHNTLMNASSVTFLHMMGALNPTAPASAAGTANNLFVEDNTVSITTMTNAGLGCADSWTPGAIVWRYNTTLNCLVTSHGVAHNGGPHNWELYGNTLQVNSGSAGQGVDSGYRLFHHQGSGEFTAFDNVFSATNGKSGAAMSMTHYRSATPGAAGYSGGRCDGSDPRDGNRAPTSTYFGYPCWHQPGRAFNGALKPMYVWNNKWTDGTPVSMLVENPWGASSPSVADHVKANRDYYTAGSGTLAARPATCTTNALEAGGGEGYWATDTNTLYRCSATNVWTTHYQPYVYPHPLTGGAPPPPAPVCSLATSNTSPVVGSSITLTATCTNGPTSWTWTGCTSSTSTCVKSETTAGSKTYTVSASNGTAGAPASLSVTWVADPAAACNASLAACNTRATNAKNELTKAQAAIAAAKAETAKAEAAVNAAKAALQ